MDATILHSDDSFESSDDYESQWRSDLSVKSTASTCSSSATSERDVWKTSAKRWNPKIWARFYPFLLARGYRLQRRQACEIATTFEDIDQEVSLQLASFEPYDSLRQAHDMKHDNQTVFIKALIPSPSSHESMALKALNHVTARSDPANHTIEILDIIECRHEDIDIIFVVQKHGGEALFEMDMDTWPEQDWQDLVLHCFEGLDFLHRQGIVHLDIGPMNVLYDFSTRLPTFIDFEGCQVHDKRETQTAFTARGDLLAVNARLPELGDGPLAAFNPFAADVWELGDMFLQMHRFPEDDLTTLFRFMTVRHPPARPTIAYALATLRNILSGQRETDYRRDPNEKYLVSVSHQ